MNDYKTSTNALVTTIILFIVVCISICIAACNIQTTQDQIDIENSDWVFMGESILIKATSVFDKNGYWEHWHLEFENGIVLNTKEWETKPYWEGHMYSIYYHPNNRKTFLEMK